MTNLNNDNQIIMNLIASNASKSTIETVKQLQDDKRKLERELNANVSNRRYVAVKRTATSAQNNETHRTRIRRKKRSDLVIAIESYLSDAMYTRKQIIEMIMFKFDCAISTVRTYLTDSKNVKYNAFSQLVIEDDKTRIMHFNDVIAKTASHIAALDRQTQISAM